MSTRVFLFLQGPHGPFFQQLTGALNDAGHQVVRVALNAGDWSLSRQPAQCLHYRGRLAKFQAWITGVIADCGVTDVLLYGDCRAYHQQVIALKHDFNLRIWVLEEGYLRPNWITLERDGVNAHSDLAQRFRAWLAHTDTRHLDLQAFEHSKPVGRTLRGLVFWCHIYYLKRFFGTLLYPCYRSHRPVSYLRETLAWLRKLTVRRLGRLRRSEQAVHSLLESPEPFYLIPLQLDADAQVIHHSNYANMGQFLDEVLVSFAQHAPKNSRLAIKVHPLDSEVVNYRRVLTQLAKRLGISSRVIFLETGAIPILLQHAAGVVTVNSTVGLQSIHHRCPTKVMGRAIYNQPELTAQCALDAFWQRLPKPKHRFYQSLRYFLLKDCQINGSFYSIRGRKVLIPELVERLLDAETRPERIVAQQRPKPHTPANVTWIHYPQPDNPVVATESYTLSRRRVM